MTAVDSFGHPINAAPDLGTPTTTPTPSDTYVWYREDKVTKALQKALQVAIRNNLRTLGSDVKSVCWDVRDEFEKAIQEC